jgi:hypothetical protein
MVNKVALGQVFLRVISSSPVSITWGMHNMRVSVFSSETVSPQLHEQQQIYKCRFWIYFWMTGYFKWVWNYLYPSYRISVLMLTLESAAYCLKCICQLRHTLSPMLILEFYWNAHNAYVQLPVAKTARLFMVLSWHLSQACLPEHELYGCTYPVMETMHCQTRHFRPLVSGHGVSGIKLCRNILLLFSVFPSLQLWLQRVWISAVQPGRERSPFSGKLALPEWTQDSQNSFNWKSFLALPSYGLATVPVHAMMTLEERGDIAHTHSWPRH